MWSIGVVSRCTFVAVEGREVVVGERRPLAAEVVVRGELAAQVRVLHLAAAGAPSPAAPRRLLSGLACLKCSTPATIITSSSVELASAREPLGERAAARTAAAPALGIAPSIFGATQIGVRW